MENRNDQNINIEIPLEQDQAAQRMIDRLDGGITPEAKKDIVSLIEKDGDLVAHAYRTSVCERLEMAKARKQDLLTRIKKVGENLDEAWRNLSIRLDPPDDPLKGLIFILCFSACFIAEFVLTKKTLPFILSVNENSFAGWMLAIAPTTALVILDVVLARLIEEPWQRLRSVTSRFSRMARASLMAIFLIALGALNYYTITQLATSREAALNAKRNLERIEGDEEIEIDTRSLDRAVMAVSITVAFDGALFLLIGLGEFKRRKERLNAQALVDGLNFTREELQEQMVQTEAQVNSLSASWKDISATSRTLADHHRHRLQFQLEQAIRRPRPQRSASDLVDEILALSLNSTAGQTDLSQIKGITAA